MVYTSELIRNTVTQMILSLSLSQHSPKPGCDKQSHTKAKQHLGGVVSCRRSLLVPPSSWASPLKDGPLNYL
jgi:hypothetical protein